jgi:beta-glucosidase
MRATPVCRCEQASPARSALLALLALLCALLPMSGLGAAPRGLAHPQLWPRAHSVGLIDAPSEGFISDLLARMSLEEKVGQVIQADIASIKPDDLRRYPLGAILAGGNTPPLGGDERAPARAWLETARAFREIALEQRPGHVPIPLLFGIDAVHGNSHVSGATLFPHNIGLGATHDPDLIRRIGEATAQETLAVGIDWIFAPTLAVPQDVRWGRSYEGYSQDPALVRRYAGAMVRGLQGDPQGAQGVTNARVAATAKHFLGDGGTTGGVDQGDTQVSEQQLIRTHAQGYLSAIDAGVMTVMVSYSSWQGHKMHGNQSLLTGVLKGRLGFDGFVVGDWNGHGQLEGCSGSTCPAAFNAGIDMFMAPESWRELFDNTLAQLRSGLIPMARLDDAVRRILRVKVKLGLFERERPWEGRLDLLGSNEHRALAREAVRKSLVLLKNNAHVLPMRASAHVLIAGTAADDIGRQCGGWTLSWQGTGNRNSDFPHAESIYAGLAAAIEAGGGSVELQADGRYARTPDVAVIVYGERPYAEFAGDRHTLAYQPDDPRDLDLLRRLKAAHVPVVSVFLSGRPLWVNPQINASDAFVAAWLPGSEGAGLADVLVGDASGAPRHDFSGTLSFTWPSSAASAARPLFPLGYGLRYTDHAVLARLPEHAGPGVVASDSDDFLLAARTSGRWSFVLDGAVRMRAVDAGAVQEGGRQFLWSGDKAASIAIAGPSLDLRSAAEQGGSLLIEYRLDAPPAAPLVLTMGCGVRCEQAAGLDVSEVLQRAPSGVWQSLKVRLSSFAAAGVDLSAVQEPLVLRGGGALGLTLKSVRLSNDATGAITLPPAAQNR